MLGLFNLFSCNKSDRTDKPMLYSLMSIENTLPDRNSNSIDNGLVLSEDDWRQIEFISTSYEDKIKMEFEGIKDIAKNYSVKLNENQYAFKKIHLRQLIPNPIEGNITLSSLVDNNYEVMKVQISDNFQGEIINGFAFVKYGVTFYGNTENNRIVNLCIKEIDYNAVDELTYRFINTLMVKNSLYLLDWNRAYFINSDSDLLKKYLNQ